MRFHTVKLALCLIGSVFFNPLISQSAVDPVVVAQNLRDLRNDNIRGNCGAVVDFFEQHLRDRAIRDALQQELYLTDAQGREAIFNLLITAKGFQPDERFIQALLTRMHSYGCPGLGGHRLTDNIHFAGNLGADYIIKHASRFGDLIAAQITPHFSGRDNSLWMQYAIARALAKGKILDRYANRYDSEFFDKLAINLKNDHIPGNAKLATMTFIFLGRLGEPTLQRTALSRDSQARRIATLLLENLSSQIDIATLISQLSSNDFIGFDVYDSEDLDLRKNVIQLPSYLASPLAPRDIL
jgi:hypothetical protein